MWSEKFFTNSYGIILSAIVCTALWGSAFPVIKLSYEALNIQQDETAQQVLFAGYRFFLSALLIFTFMILIRRKVSYKKGSFKPLLKISFFQTYFQYVLFYIGLSYSTGIQGAIIAGTTSFFQIIFAHFMYKNDKISMRKTVGLFVGFTGVILVNITQGTFEFQFGFGELCLSVAMISSAYGNILARNGAQTLNVMYLTASQMLIGGFGLLITGVVFAGFMPFQFTLYSFGLLLYLSFLSAAGFVIWNNVMKYNNVGQVSMYLFLIPVFGVLLSSILLDEVIHLFVLLGLSFVTSGIIIVNRKKSDKQVKIRSAS
ncbi:EamA family transporter [Anaerobacillus alkalidiazotrophicus]|uniref:EamA family transporter n=1 Tax=Anaerobacillus alkalidiazotrophicus TaxID=472963 RepID=A0A1S2M0B8_9BACI|nr:DMT family transporter [Anaerobacillus alkalidiazotrophicus]OIJ18139.1 EamA family transporter [Anaerobacillus alkalidiazotrophicus]OIJ19618.1 EamA family transporter [Anaerobacillus alkalidiazotrophicus]